MPAQFEYCLLENIEGIIVGQGLAGTLLAHELAFRSVNVRLIDDGSERTSSKVAAGLYNPITGRKMVKTWLADEIFPGLPQYYEQLEELTRRRFHHPIGIYRPFTRMEEQNDWQSRAGDPHYSDYIAQFHQRSVGIDGVVDPFGGLDLRYSGYLDLPVFLSAMREYFQRQGMLVPELFHYNELRLNQDGVEYGGFKANWIVFCEGPRVVDNPYFQGLKFRLVRGDLIGIKADVGLKHIVNRGVFMIPKEQFVQVGSTYDHQVLDWLPTARGVKELEERLRKLYVNEYLVVDKRAGVRPATFDRRPYLGMLEKTPRIGIFNGLGAKGVSLGPHFAQLMTKHLIDGAPLPAEVSIER